MADTLLAELPAAVRFVTGDQHYKAPNVRECCAQHDQILVATRRGAYPHTDEGVEVRRIFHKLRSFAIENFKGIFDAHGQVPTKGLRNTKRWALGAILLYQLAIWYRFEHGLTPCVGIKAFLKAA